MIETVSLNSCCKLGDATAELTYYPGKTVEGVSFYYDPNICSAVVDTVEKARETIALLNKFIELKEGE